AVTGLVPPDEGKAVGFFELMWMNLMRLMDAGAVGGDKGSWPFLLMMLFTTFAGIFVFSMLIGILTSGLESKLEELRKGRSLVVENDHTVILGWSERVFSILSELAIANESNPGACVAILADKDKVEMEDEIKGRVALGKMRVVCRNGNPLQLSDLGVINLHASKAIILLAPEESSDPDSYMIKAILAITNNPKRRKEPYHIVATIKDPRNHSVAKMVGKDEVEVVLADSFISRLAVQTCRQTGLSVVYQELLDFDGDDIYFKEEPSLTGKTFRDAVFAYDKSALMGLRLKNGGIVLNPPPETVLAAGDKVIALTEDDSTLLLSNKRDFPIDAAALREAVVRERKPEKTLILGWNKNATTVINELDDYVTAGSEIAIYATTPEAEEQIAENCISLQNLKFSFTLADTTDRGVLEALRPQDYDYIMTLGYSDDLDPQDADAKTLLTLLHLRDMASRAGLNFSIVSEMLDANNRELAQIAQVDDFIVSDKFISLMLSQIAENKELNQLFADLLKAEGNEIY
ncbi:MAG TPA: hypothetical protein V6D23_10215, partial [Candidatus Obscuribacterales bacterium]